MGLFKNKVGRPSNETIKKRRSFYLVVFLGIIVVSSVVVLNFRNINAKNLKGLAVSMPSVKYTKNKVVNDYGYYNVNYYIKNNNAKKYYYKVFSYSNDDYASSSFNKTTDCKVIDRFSSKKILKKVEISKNKLTGTYKLKIYNDLDYCKRDLNGVLISNNISSYPVIISYKK